MHPRPRSSSPQASGPLVQGYAPREDLTPGGSRSNTGEVLTPRNLWKTATELKAQWRCLAEGAGVWSELEK